MNERIMQQLGFGRQVELKKKGKCVFCEEDVDVSRDFTDDKSRREYEISGICQQCQDKTFR
jgi:hypothetical protein